MSLTYVQLNVLQDQVCCDALNFHTVINGDLCQKARQKIDKLKYNDEKK